MKKEKPMGLLINGSLRSSGVTFYLKKGRMVARSARSMERRSNTREQFIQRQRIRHITSLWQSLKWCKPMFTEHTTAYWGFLSLAARMPAVYTTKNMVYASLLMPGIPVGDGTLPPVGQQLGEVDGVPALLTDLTADRLQHGDQLRLFTATQQIHTDTPMVLFGVREVEADELIEVDGKLALVGDDFADEMKGWALVHVSGKRCSPQQIVTQSTYYQQYTTEEALQRAAKSYGGLTR